MVSVRVVVVGFKEFSVVIVLCGFLFRSIFGYWGL